MLQIRNERVNRLAEKLAAIKRSSKTEAVRLALENELARIEGAKTLRRAAAADPRARRQAAADRPGCRQGVLRRTQRRPMIFVDASAIVAILTGEAEDAALIAALERAEGAVTSPIAIYEAALACAEDATVRSPKPRTTSWEFLAAARIGVAAVEPAAAQGALAPSRATQGHAASRTTEHGRLLCLRPSKALNARLLYKGADFSMTDIEAAR